MIELINKILESTKYGFDLDDLDNQSDDDSDDSQTSELMNDTIDKTVYSKFPEHDSKLWDNDIFYKKFQYEFSKLIYKTDIFDDNIYIQLYLNEKYAFRYDYFKKPSECIDVQDGNFQVRIEPYVSGNRAFYYNIEPGYANRKLFQHGYEINDVPQIKSKFLGGSECPDLFNKIYMEWYMNFSFISNLFPLAPKENLSALFTELEGVRPELKELNLKTYFGFSPDQNVMYLYNFKTECLNIKAKMRFSKLSDFTICFQNNVEFKDGAETSLAITIVADSSSTLECETYTLTLDARNLSTQMPWMSDGSNEKIKLKMNNYSKYMTNELSMKDIKYQKSSDSRVCTINLTQSFPGFFNNL